MVHIKRSQVNTIFRCPKAHARVFVIVFCLDVICETVKILRAFDELEYP